MPVALFTDPARALNVYRFRPVVSAEDLRRVAEAIREAKFDRTFNELVWYDANEVRISFEPGDLVRFAHYISGMQNMLPHGLRRRSAIVGGRSSDDAMAQAFITFFPQDDKARTQYRVFRDMDEALAWLDRPGPVDVGAMQLILDSRLPQAGAA